MQQIIELTQEQVPLAYAEFIEPYFPDNEVKPLKHILQMMQENGYTVLGLEVEGELVGCAFMVKPPQKRTYLLDYLATHEKLRSRGYGSMLLAAVQEYISNEALLLIETELLDDAKSEDEKVLRQRRYNFYERNGAMPSTLITDIWGAIYTIWTLGNREGHNIEKEMDDIYKYMVPADLYQKFVHIPKE